MDSINSDKAPEPVGPYPMRQNLESRILTLDNP